MLTIDIPISCLLTMFWCPFSDLNVKALVGPNRGLSMIVKSSRTFVASSTDY